MGAGIRDRRADAAGRFTRRWRRCFRRSTRGRPTTATSCSSRRSGRTLHARAALRARIAEEPFRTALPDVWRAVDLDGLLAHYLANDAVTRALGRLDARRGQHRRSQSSSSSASRGRSGIRDRWWWRRSATLARAMGASRPPLDGDAGINWPATETAWANFVGWDAQTESLRAALPSEQLRQDALRLYYSAGDVARARELWRRLADAPRDPSELAMAADLEADAGSDAALPLVETLRRDQPAEADVILATLRARQGKLDEATAALVAACVRLRDDPWPHLRFKEQALNLAAALGRGNPDRARRLYAAIGQPFAVHAIDETRLLTQADLSAQFDFAGSCREPIGAFEPNVPWTAAFLVVRRDCYRAAGDPRLEVALRDLNAFVAQQPQPLAAR